MKPCGHDVVLEPGLPYEEGSCRICWLHANDPAYRRLWADAETAGRTADVRGVMARTRERRGSLLNPLFPPCLYLGPATGEVKSCEACGGRKDVPLHHCARHGRCVVNNRLLYREGGRTVEVAWCRTCPDYKRTDARRLTLVNRLSPGDCLVRSRQGGAPPRPAGRGSL